MLGDTLSDAHNERDLSGDGLLDTSGSKRGAGVAIFLSASPKQHLRTVYILRDEDGGGIGASLLYALSDIGEDGEAEMCLAGLLGVCASNNLGT